MLKAIKTILVGIGFIIGGAVVMYVSFEKEQVEPTLIGGGAIILGLLAVFGGIRSLWVPSAVGGGGGGLGDKPSAEKSIAAILGQSRRRVIKPHDCAVELPFDL